MFVVSLVLASATVAAEDDIAKYLFPSTTIRLAIVNFAAIRDSGYWTEDIDNGFERGFRDNEQFERISKLMEIDPKNLRRFTICETDQGTGRDRVLFIVNGNFAYDKAVKGLAEMGASGELTALSIHEQPVYYNHRSREASYFALIDHQTIIFGATKELLTDSLDGLKDLREPNKDLADRMNWQATADFAVRLAGKIPDEAKRGLKNVPQFEPIADKLVGYNFVGTLGESPRLQMRLSMEDETSASQAVNALNAMIALGKLMGANSPRPDLFALLDKVNVRSDESDVLAEITISQKQFGEIVVQNREDREKFEARIKERREQRRKMREAGKQQPPADGKKPPPVQNQLVN